MELFTTELTKYKKLSENLTKNCELLQTEVNILNKLLFFEQKFSDQLINELFVLYDKCFSDSQHNYRYFDVIKQLEDQKSIANQNKTQIKKLRQELNTWRQINNRLNNDIQNGDHSYSSGTDSMTKIKNILPNNSNESKIKSQSTVCAVAQPSTSAEEVKHEASSSSVSVKMEVIPKIEAEECLVNEETDSSSEADCVIEGVEPTPESPPSAQPFLFVSEYLSKNKTFSHLLEKNKEQSMTSEDNTKTIDEDKRVAIDLNTDSDTETTNATGANREVAEDILPNQSIFEDKIIDLTPNEVKSPKKKSPKKSFIKKRIRFTKKRTTLRSLSKPIQSPEKNTLITEEQSQNTRIIGSNRKKIHFNPDNTITITELRGSAEKKSKPEDTLISNQSPINPMSRLSRTEKARTNEDIIKSTKKIVFKGKIYYCRWKQCSFSTEHRANAIRHLWKHTGEQPFKCQLCPQGFRDKRNLATHVMTHNAEKDTGASEVGALRGKRGTGSLICPECSSKYQHFWNLVRHIKGVHGSAKADKYKQQYYKQRSLLNNTLDAEKQNTSSQKTTKNRTKRNSIEKSPKARLELSLKPISPKKFYKNSPKNTINESIEMTANTEMNGTEAAAEWMCDFKACSRSYGSKGNLRRHQMEIHKKLSKPLFYGTNKSVGKDVKYFIPKPTQKAMNSPKNAKTVENIKTIVAPTDDTSVKSFLCNFKDCKNSYFTISGLYKHKKTVHKSKTTWTSTAQKAKKFPNNTSGQLTDDKNSSPSKSTSKKSDSSLNKGNKWSAKSERKWSCPQEGCDSRFVWAKNLKTHMRDKHNISKNTELIPDITGAKADEKFQCPYSGCPFEAGSRHAQVTHYRTHFSSEDKPFKCLIKDCDYSTAKLSLLKYHVLNRHSEQQFFRAMEETGVQYPSWY